MNDVLPKSNTKPFTKQKATAGVAWWQIGGLKLVVDAGTFPEGIGRVA